METTANGKTDIASLIDAAIKDRKAAGGLFQAFSRNLYREARIYVADDELAKKSVMQGFRNAYPNLAETDADTIEDWLKQYVKDECIKNTVPLDSSATVYSADDEVPGKTASVPSDEMTVKKQLLALLNSLTPSQRLTVVLRYRDQLSFEQIAEKCGADVNQVKGLISDAKNTLRAANISLGPVFARIDRLYPLQVEAEPVETEPEPATVEETEVRPWTVKAVPEEDQFDQSVQELKDFFNTKTLSVRRISDHDIDDAAENQNEGESETAESDSNPQQPAISNSIQNTASSAKLIMAAAMSAETEKKEPAKEYNPILYWAKRAALVLLLVVIGFGVGILISVKRHNTPKPAESAEPVMTETPSADAEGSEATDEPEETSAPEETADADEPANNTLGNAVVLVTDLTIRSGPGVGYEQTGLVEVNATYPVYESVSADGYTWYRIGDGQWIADLGGQYVSYTPNS